MDIIREYYEKAGVPSVVLKKKITSFEKHPDIAREFEHWINTREYMVEDCVVVENYSAKNIAGLSEFVDGEGAFSLLIQLREKPQKALKRIEDGFKMI